MEENTKSECITSEHNFIPLFENGIYVGSVCSRCGKHIAKQGI